MEERRLTTQAQPLPLTDFLRCQLCGHTSTDLCEFSMWYECDDADQPETDKLLLVCRERCEQVIRDHPRAYQQLAWGAGLPGHFILVCGPCPWRQGSDCRHPDLKKNGGEGLQVYQTSMWGQADVTICYHDQAGGHHCYRPPAPVTDCDGLKGRGHDA